MPDGIDLYLDNVGGGLQESVMERMRQFGRFVITGTVSEYGMDVPPPGPNLFATVRRGFSIHGFIATQYYDRFEEFHEEMQSHLADGRVKAPVDVVEGLDQAAAAMAGMLAGDNVGQRLIRIAPDPTL
jgi:NADPH-dependent curcumin reductase CurA